MTAVVWNKITVAGVGLLGGSLGMALRQRRVATEVVGFVRRQATAVSSVRCGAVDRATRKLGEAVAGADLIVLCTPLAQMPSLLKPALPFLKEGTIITDVGSAKATVVRTLEPLCARVGCHFVGSHPMAGSERTGVEAARADLFNGAVCVVTPTRKSNADALRKVERLWRAVDCTVLRLSPGQHDYLVSRSSHLPQVAAAALVNCVLGPGSRRQAQLCANGFRDTTRIASGSPEMWRDIALANDRELIRALDDLFTELRAFRQVLRRRDREKIMAFYARAAAARGAWLSGNVRRSQRRVSRSDESARGKV